MAGHTGPPVLLKALQHNCARGGQVMEAVLETAVRRGADLVLIQEPRGEREKDSTRSHPSFTFIKGEQGVAAKCWIAVNRASWCRVTELKELARECRNHAHVVEVIPPGGDAIIIANVYDRHEGRDETNRPAQRAAWGEIAKHRRVIVAGDMNGHSKMWNPKANYNKKPHILGAAHHGRRPLCVEHRGSHKNGAGGDESLHH